MPWKARRLVHGKKFIKKQKNKKNSQLTLMPSGADVSGPTRLTPATTPHRAPILSHPFAQEARTRRSRWLSSVPVGAVEGSKDESSPSCSRRCHGKAPICGKGGSSSLPARSSHGMGNLEPLPPPPLLLPPHLPPPTSLGAASLAVASPAPSPVVSSPCHSSPSSSTHLWHGSPPSWPHALVAARQRLESPNLLVDR